MSVLVCKACKALVSDTEKSMERHVKICKKRENIHDLMTPHAETPRGRITSNNGNIELAYLRGRQSWLTDLQKGKK